jgi:hypothetical protein
MCCWKDNMMNKLKKIFTLVVVLFLTLISFSCVSLPKLNHETNFQNDLSMGRLKIINHGGSVLPTLLDNVKYYIDGNKVASHNSDANFETMVQLPPGEHNLIVDYGKSYKCKYNFMIGRAQIGAFNNYSYYTYVMDKADKADLEPWGFQNINALIMEKKVDKTKCNDIANDVGRKICKEYYDKLCR